MEVDLYGIKNGMCEHLGRTFNQRMRKRGSAVQR